MKKRRESDAAGKWFDGISMLLAEAFAEAERRGDGAVLVTVWTAKGAPTSEERERMHDQLVGRYGAGFVGTMGSGEELLT